MDIFKPVANQLISHLINGDKTNIKELDAYLPLESRALFNWIKENPADKEALEKLKSNLAQQMSTDKDFAEKVDQILYPAEKIIQPLVANSLANTGAISENGDVNIKGKYAAGRDINVKNIFSAKKLIISSFIILAIVIGYLSRGTISEIFEGSLSFPPNDTSFKILLLPFRADQDYKEIHVNYKDQLIERLQQKRELEGLGVNLLNIDKGIEVPHTDEDAKKIGTDKNADLVIWGSYEETRGEDNAGAIRLRYVILRDFDLDHSKKKGDTDMQELKSPSQLRKGYLQEDIDYILHWVEGINAYKDGDFKQAYRHFDIINRDFSEEEYQIETYMRLGDISSRIGENEDALKYHKKADTLLMKQLHLHHPRVATNYVGMANAYRRLGDYKSSLELNNKALEIRKKNFSEDDPILAGSYYQVGKEHIWLSKPVKAIEFLEKALDIQLKNEKTESKIAKTYFFLGWAYNYTPEVDKALENHQKALEIYEKMDSKPALSAVGLCYGNLASTYTRIPEIKKAKLIEKKGSIDTSEWNKFAEENYQMALNNQRKGLKILEDVYDRRHPNVGSGYRVLGKCYLALGEYDSTFHYYRKAIDVYKTVYKDKPHLRLGDTYSELAEVYVRVEDYETALEHLQTSLEITLSAIGTQEHVVVAEIYRLMGEVYYKLKLYNPAMNNVKKSRELWKLLETYPEMETATLELEKEIKSAMG